MLSSVNSVGKHNSSDHMNIPFGFFQKFQVIPSLTDQEQTNTKVYTLSRTSIMVFLLSLLRIHNGYDSDSGVADLQTKTEYDVTPSL